MKNPLRSKTILLALTIGLLSSNAWALKSDTDQPVYIDSDTQHLDMQSNKVTFSGNVKLKQGSIRVNADKIVVYRNKKTGKLSRIMGYGKPTTFSQKGDDGKLLKGKGETLEYAVDSDTITVSTHAELQQGKSIIKGSKITYVIGSQVLNANSGNGRRVSTVLMPNELKGN